jgi:hypothetical protein
MATGVSITARWMILVIFSAGAMVVWVTHQRTGTMGIGKAVFYLTLSSIFISFFFFLFLCYVR